MRWLKRRHRGSAAGRLASGRSAFWHASRLNRVAQATTSGFAPARRSALSSSSGLGWPRLRRGRCAIRCC
eukprot:8475502-Alexandrium_andersonii.AAC.1